MHVTVWGKESTITFNYFVLTPMVHDSCCALVVMRFRPEIAETIRKTLWSGTNLANCWTYPQRRETHIEFLVNAQQICIRYDEIRTQPY